MDNILREKKNKERESKNQLVKEEDLPFLAFSSNLVHLNKCNLRNLFTFRQNQNTPDEISIKVLKDSWRINNPEELKSSILYLQQSDHQQAYLNTVKLLEENPALSPGEIILSRQLNLTEANRLWFAADLQTKLGPQGLEAWDLGRALTLLRWGTTSLYLSPREAVELANPLIERILGRYASW